MTSVTTPRDLQSLLEKVEFIDNPEVNLPLLMNRYLELNKQWRSSRAVAYPVDNIWTALVDDYAQRLGLPFPVEHENRACASAHPDSMCFACSYYEESPLPRRSFRRAVQIKSRVVAPLLDDLRALAIEGEINREISDGTEALRRMANIYSPDIAGKTVEELRYITLKAHTEQTGGFIRRYFTSEAFATLWLALPKEVAEASELGRCILSKLASATPCIAIGLTAGVLLAAGIAGGLLNRQQST